MNITLSNEAMNGYASQPHTITINGFYLYQEYAIIAWCKANFGDRNEKFNNPRWSYDKFKSKFRFKYEKDAAWFMMRWG